MKNRFIKGVAAASLLFAALSFGGTAQAATEHCPDHNGNPGKVESGSSGNSIVLAAGTQFCVKGSTGATGTLTADGSTSLIEYMEQFAPRNNGGNVPDVSYYIVYKTPTPATTTPQPTTTAPQPTTTQPAGPTTTEPAGPTTTEPAGPTTTEPAGPTTTDPAAPTTQPPPQPPRTGAAPPAPAPAPAPRALPETGAATTGIAIAALGTLLVGAALAYSARRRDLIS